MPPVQSGPVGSKCFERRPRVLDIGTLDPTHTDSSPEIKDAATPNFDLDRLKDLIQERRKRLAPGSSITIRVDGIDRGLIDVQNSSYAAVFEKGASVVKTCGSG